ncbi:hypothetical protein [Streptomyces violaceus]|uniref:hypothetical protein n=1 Tax=Streptomyces violaceus TaxID=1936 RepID=UPI003CD0AC83
MPIKDENQTLATITLQNFFRLYKRHDHSGKEQPGLCGMTVGHDRGRPSSTRSTSLVWCRSRPTGRWSARTSRI